MATSSIFSTVSITTKQQAEDFVSVLKRSEKDSSLQKRTSSVDIHPSREALKNLLKKRFTVK